MNKIKLNSYEKFVLIIPIINILADIFTNNYEAATINPGSIRALIFLAFIAYFLYKGHKLDRVSKFIIVYLLYLLILTMFSSNKAFSLMLYIKVAIAFMMFPLGYYYINNLQKFKLLNISYIIVIAIIILNLIISNYFHLGTSDYDEGSFYFGSARVNITKTLASVLLCAPIMFLLINKKKNRLLLAVIVILGIILVFIGVKRAAVGTVSLGLIYYLILTPRKGRVIKYLAFFAVIAIAAAPLYMSTIQERFLARESRIELNNPQNLDEEGRYKEYNMVIDGLSKDNIFHTLFGDELFNDREYFNVPRMLHTDYMILLNGSGIVGILFFFGFYWVLIKEKNKYAQVIKENKLLGEFNAVLWAIILGMLITSIAGSVYNMGLRSMGLMYMGAILRLMKEENRIALWQKSMLIQTAPVIPKSVLSKN